jgi:hypothetical protein
MKQHILKSRSKLLIIALLLIGTELFAQIPQGITISISSGNSKELAKHFNNDIELVILDKEDVYSRYQAEHIMKDFFIKYSPQSFNILHEGGKEGSRYAIGNLNTSNGVFRVYFLIKQKNNQPFIHQLRIERESGN